MAGPLTDRGQGKDKWGIQTPRKGYREAAVDPGREGVSKTHYPWVKGKEESTAVKE